MPIYSNPPSSHMLAAVRNQNMKTHVCFAELIDNSLDANAERVTITTKNKRILVCDNGVGVPNLLAMTQFGGHQTEGRSTSGKFGVGGIEAICNLGDTLIVETVRNGQMQTARLDFVQQHQSKNWDVDIEAVPVSDSVECGTRITITNLKTTWIQNTTLIKNLQEMFAPAIKNGKKIIVDGLTIGSPDQVPLEMETSGEGVLNGKSFKWFAGIIPESSNQAGGWNVALRNRMMDGYQYCGIEAGCSIKKFYGYIELLEDDMSNRWSVDKHKNSCEEVEAICDSLWPSIQHLIIKCNELDSIKLDSTIADEVGRELNELMQSVNYKIKANQKEDRKTNPDEKDDELDDDPNTGPNRKGGPRINISNGQLGDKELNVKNFLGKKFAIVPENSDYYGWVTGNSKGNTIHIGKHHPYWELHKHNKEIVYIVAVHLLVNYATTLDDKKQPVWWVLEREAGLLSQIAFDTLNKIMAKRAAMVSA